MAPSPDSNDAGLMCAAIATRADACAACRRASVRCAMCGAKRWRFEERVCADSARCRALNVPLPICFGAQSSAVSVPTSTPAAPPDMAPPDEANVDVHDAVDAAAAEAPAASQANGSEAGAVANAEDGHSEDDASGEAGLADVACPFCERRLSPRRPRACFCVRFGNWRAECAICALARGR